jgi:hypothetical protein
MKATNLRKRATILMMVASATLIATLTGKDNSRVNPGLGGLRVWNRLVRTVMLVFTVCALSGAACGDDIPDDGDDEYVTIKGKVTDCKGEPLSAVTVTAGEATGMTDGEGKYSILVPAHTDVTVTVESGNYGNYSPEVAYNITGKAKGKVVTQDISLPCLGSNPNDPNNPPNPPTKGIPEKASITYHRNDGELIITYDNYGKRFRTDADYGTAKHGVMIFDDLTQRNFSWSVGDKEWYHYPSYKSGSALSGCSNFFDNDNLYIAVPGYSVLSTQTIAGKSCRTVALTAAGCVTKYGGWNGLLMLTEITCGELLQIATKVSLTIPSNAFTETENIF